MITKEVFVNTMKRIAELNRKMENADDALTKLCPDFCGLYIPESFDILSDLLKEVFDDKDGWIDYFMYELDYLRRYEKRSVVDKLSNPIDCSSWEKVYDFLIDVYNIQEKENV
jgi:hypothetical protein